MFRPFLGRADRERIAALIREVEENTTGEIVVHVVHRAGHSDVLRAARAKFLELGLDKTRHRNAVLLLISHLEHRFALWGDEAIHEKGGRELWDKAAASLRSHFIERRYAQGIEACVREVGDTLARLFPRRSGDGGPELSSEVTED